MINPIALFLTFFFALNIYSHGSAGSFSKEETKDRSIDFPDTKQYKTLVADLHTHSVFSDGHVWPTIRVEEALRDGVDVLAVTEHLEYQPHNQDIPHKNRNRSYEEARIAASNKNIIIINGSEITREMPPGHINAVFIKDANKLFNIEYPKNNKDKDDLKQMVSEMQWGGIDNATKEQYILGNMWPAENAIEAANKQGAFLFWNHPDWHIQSSDGKASLNPMHQDMIKQGYLHGIEVVNGNGYSEEAFEIALDNNLTIIGTSDVHDLIDWDYKPYLGGHRPVTLIFVGSKTENSIQNALKDRRTVIWFKNTLIGLKRNILPLLEASLSIESANYRSNTELLGVTIKNISDARFVLKNMSPYTFTNSHDLVEIPSQGSKYLEVKTNQKLSLLELDFEVLNALEAPKVTSKLTLKKKVN